MISFIFMLLFQYGHQIPVHRIGPSIPVYGRKW